MLKTEAGGRGFQHVPRDLAIVNAMKTMFGRYCIKTENICYTSRYFLHCFVSPFHRCLANAISTDYARSRAGQYTSRNGSKSMAPVRSYSKLRSRALTAPELPCQYMTFRLLITCYTAFYAIMKVDRYPASDLLKSISDRYRPESNPNGPIMVRYRFK